MSKLQNRHITEGDYGFYVFGARYFIGYTINSMSAFTDYYLTTDSKILNISCPKLGHRLFSAALLISSFLGRKCLISFIRKTLPPL